MHVYKFMYVNTHISVCLDVSMFVCMYVCMHECMLVCLYVCMYVNFCANIHVSIGSLCTHRIEHPYALRSSSILCTCTCIRIYV